MIVVFEGPDMVGKTTIARALSQRTRIPYFKRTGETEAFARSPDPQTFFYNTLVHAGTFLADFLEQTRPDVIMDRSYPSERVYSRIYGRKTDMALHEVLDQTYWRAGALFVVCLRDDYAGLSDPDSGEKIDAEKMKLAHDGYVEFARWTRCPTLVLHTDGWKAEDRLERQLEAIERFIKESKQ